MRKTAQVTISDEGRDKSKVFLITDMPAEQAESWAMRVLLALMASGAQLPDTFPSLGMAGLAEVGFRALATIRWDTLHPLLAEMFATIQIKPDRKNPNVVRELIDSDIEEIMTRVTLRKEWWNLHMGFLAAVAPSLIERVKPAAKNSSPTATSQK